MWSHIRSLLGGMMSVMTFSPSPLYRYPYRNSAEAFRGDWSRIGKDISYICEQMQQPGDLSDE